MEKVLTQQRESVKISKNVVDKATNRNSCGECWSVEANVLFTDDPKHVYKYHATSTKAYLKPCEPENLSVHFSLYLFLSR